MFSGQHFAILEMFILKMHKKICFFRCTSISSSDDRESLTHRSEIDSPSDFSDPSDLITQNGMLLKMECHSKWNVTQNGMSLKMEVHSKWKFTQME